MDELTILLVLLAVGFIFGTLLERSHYKSVIRREGALRSLPAIASKKLPEEFNPCETRLVAGNVVISIDYFKKFIAGLRNLVGGRVTSYEGRSKKTERRLRFQRQNGNLVHFKRTA